MSHLNDDDFVDTTPITTQPPPDTLPTDDDSVEAPAPEAASALPMGVIIFAGYTEEALVAMWDAAVSSLGAEAAAAALMRGGTYENIIAQAADHSAKNASARMTADVISRLDDAAQNAFAPRCVDDAQKIRVASAPQRRLQPAQVPQELSGHEGFMRLLMNQPGAVRRVTHLNSGFHSDIRQPTKQQLHDLVTKADLTVQEYGRWAGVYYMLYADIELKRLLTELLLSCITSTNLADGRNPAVMMEHFKLPDLLPALMQLAALMFPNGYPQFQYICTNTACKHISCHTVDLSKFVYHNFSRVPTGSLQRMSLPHPGSAPGTTVTGDALREYTASLKLERTKRFGLYEFSLKVPSLAEYFRFGEQFNAQLMEVHHSTSGEELVGGVTARLASIFTPWIEKLTVYHDPADGFGADVVQYTVEDPYIITKMLDTLQSDEVLNANDAFVSALVTYAADAQLSLVCHPAAPCPKCGTVPATATGFVTVDPIQCFFTMCLSKLGMT